VDKQSGGVLTPLQLLELQTAIAAETGSLGLENVGLGSTLPMVTQIREGLPISVVDPEHAHGGGLPLSTMEPGADLRDLGSPGPAGGLPAVLGVAALVRLLAPSLATRAAPVIRAVASPGMRFSLGSLPSWLQTALVAVGATVGIDMLMDLAGDGVSGSVDESLWPQIIPHLVDGLPVHLGAHVVGSWVANGVTFYRLSDGKLAVQNKRGRWKVWKPKKPIVIMPTGAVDLRTMLRADAVLNKQAKRLAAMLNRRAPRRKTSRSTTNSDSVIVMDGKVVTK